LSITAFAGVDDQEDVSVMTESGLTQSSSRSKNRRIERRPYSERIDSLDIVSVPKDVDEVVLFNEQFECIAKPQSGGLVWLSDRFRRAFLPTTDRRDRSDHTRRQYQCRIAYCGCYAGASTATVSSLIESDDILIAKLRLFRVPKPYGKKDVLCYATVNDKDFILEHFQPKAQSPRQSVSCFDSLMAYARSVCREAIEEKPSILDHQFADTVQQVFFMLVRILAERRLNPENHPKALELWQTNFLSTPESRNSIMTSVADEVRKAQNLDNTDTIRPPPGWNQP
jgi:hypothetical protein